jgi:hypothetical protein
VSILKPKSIDAASLSNEIADARQRFIETRNSVIDRAIARQQAVQESIRNLQAESAALSDVEAEARNA